MPLHRASLLIRPFASGLYPDTAAELCRLLNINRSQLPPTLELGPGEEIPKEFAHILETKPNAEGHYEVDNPSQSAEANATGEDAHPLIDTDALGPVN